MVCPLNLARFEPRHYDSGVAPRSFAFRLFRGLVAAILVAYLVVLGFIWYTQAALIFRPSKEVGSTPAESGVKFDEVALPIGNDRLTGWWVPSDDPEARTLLYLHGNAGNISPNRHHVLRLRAAGLNVFIIDYRGYGNSTGGPPRETLVYEDAERAWTYLVSERHIPPANIVIYGHSLGGAVAIDLASKHPDAGALVTESTFTSIAEMADRTLYGKFLPIRFILTERFDSISKIGSVRAPKLILHGENDVAMASPLMARRLYDAAADPKEIAVIPGGGHEDSAEVNPTAYFAALNTFLSRYHLVSAVATAR
jgi:pimeloyl-ACP methyl ester carboxylesterase